jgi:hypothetical protein
MNTNGSNRQVQAIGRGRQGTSVTRDQLALHESRFLSEVGGESQPARSVAAGDHLVLTMNYR